MAVLDKDMDLKATIEAVVRERIRSGKIVNISIEDASDAGVDRDIIVVNVVFDGAKSLDAHETSQLARHVWKRLIEKDISGFPSFSFISRSEAGKLAAA